MPATAWPQFCGGSYTSRGPQLDQELTVNLYPATVASQTNAKQHALFSTPGLEPLIEVSTTGCRGLYSEDGKTWAVVGAILYELDLTANTATVVGTIADDGKPVSFASNGRGGEQLAICGGGELKVLDLDTNVLSGPIALPLTNPLVSVAFIDGYGLLLEADTVKVYFSALEDFTDVDALDFFARSQTSDNFVAMAVLRDRIWMMGSESTEIYFNSGDADVPFVPYPGAIMHYGITGHWAAATDGEAMYWLAQADSGRASVVRALEGQVQEISTDAIDFQIASATSLEDVEAMPVWQEGHQFVAFTLPSCATCGVTLVWDQDEQLWHTRGSWDQTTATFFRWRVRGLASTDAGLIVGDFEHGNLYRLSLDCFTENGAAIRRVRRAPYVSSDANLAFIDQIELGARVGVGLNQGQGSDPQVMGRVSRDGGMTWTPYVSAPLGAMGRYDTRVVFRRLGRVRLDRFVFEISQTDPVPATYGPGLWMRITPGSGAL